ncbi:MAG: ThuA domain-containing protein, partial [Planctomycetes bacterium]|nr:ThuA domain-containing protein [Planctomycetota bacterium]
GSRSHGYGSHEFNDGYLLMKKLLDGSSAAVHSTVYLNQRHLKPAVPVMSGGWPKDPTAFDNADSIVLFMNGGGGHPVNRHLAEIDALMKKGVGLACLHYGVEVPKGKSGNSFLDWTGGYFEAHWSVNPHWTIENVTLAKDHPITDGVKPFTSNDEWYFHMRFRDKMEGVTPILSAVAPKETMKRGDGAHSGNPAVRASVAKGDLQHVAWARQRPDGGRGFGFTGLHYHKNFADDDFRKLVLNAMVWVAGGEVPKGGVDTPKPSEADLKLNQDYAPRKK